MTEYAAGNIFIREGFFEKAGDATEGHFHNFDHVTYVFRGAIKIERLAEDGSVEREVIKRATDGRNWVLIKKDVRHRLTALVDDSGYQCIYSHRTPQGEVTEEYDGWGAAYV